MSIPQSLFSDVVVVRRASVLRPTVVIPCTGRARSVPRRTPPKGPESRALMRTTCAGLRVLTQGMRARALLTVLADDPHLLFRGRTPRAGIRDMSIEEVLRGPSQNHAGARTVAIFLTA